MPQNEDIRLADLLLALGLLLLVVLSTIGPTMGV